MTRIMKIADNVNLFLITGSDEASIRTEAERIVRRVAGENPDAFSLDVIREQESVPPLETINQVVRSILSPPFFGDRKTVWLQNFEHFDGEGSQKSQTPLAAAFRALCEVLEKGLPPNIFLVLSGPKVDGRKGLAKVCGASGQVTVCDKPEIRERDWRSRMAGLLRQRADDKGVRLPREVCEYLMDVLGTDTERIDCELEKLICYGGGTDKPITLDAAQAVCAGQGEAVSWALSNAVGERDSAKALELVDVLLRQGRDPEQAAHGLLIQLANYFRQLLQVRIFMQHAGLKSAQAVMDAVQKMADDERKKHLANGLDIVAFHAFRTKMIAQNALNYSGQELTRAIAPLRDACRRCISSSVSARVLLEQVIMTLIEART